MRLRRQGRGLGARWWESAVGGGRRRRSDEWSHAAGRPSCRLPIQPAKLGCDTLLVPLTTCSARISLLCVAVGGLLDSV